VVCDGGADQLGDGLIGQVVEPERPVRPDIQASARETLLQSHTRIGE
jgi:hypothetical protein